MNRILLCLCMLAGLMVAGCGEKLTDAEKNTPPVLKPGGGHVAPPAGAVRQMPRGGGGASIPPPGAPGGPAPMR